METEGINNPSKDSHQNLYSQSFSRTLTIFMVGVFCFLEYLYTVKRIILSESEKNLILSKHALLKEQFPKDKSTQERIEYIKGRLDFIQNIFPLVEKYVEAKWGDDVKMKGSIRDIHFGHENFSGQQAQFDFFIDETNQMSAVDIKHEIMSDLRNLFNFNLGKYGEPINLRFSKKQWQEI